MHVELSVAQPPFLRQETAAAMVDQFTESLVEPGGFRRISIAFSGDI
jgi:hypothetical protein